LLGVGRKADNLLRKKILLRNPKKQWPDCQEGQLAEASEEGLGPKGAVVPMMMKQYKGMLLVDGKPERLDRQLKMIGIGN